MAHAAHAGVEIRKDAVEVAVKLRLGLEFGVLLQKLQTKIPIVLALNHAFTKLDYQIALREGAITLRLRHRPSFERPRTVERARKP